MKTNKIYTVLCSLFLSILLCSCGPLIFRANFNEDTVGNAPNPNPPGNPSDDEIKGNCGISVVNTSVLGSKAMKFSNDSDCVFGLMWFESGNVPESNKFLNYAFTGYAESTNHKNFSISFVGEHFRAAFTILYDGGTMYLTDGGYSGHNIGTYTANQKQTYLVGINRETNTYSILVGREGMSNISLNHRPVKEASFWGQSAYLLFPYYDVNDNNTSTNGYVFDNVTINKERPE